jgi:hypothetical protein
MKKRRKITKPHFSQTPRKLALLEKIKGFPAVLLPNFESMCKDMVKKIDHKDTKNSHFSKQTEFGKKPIILLAKQSEPSKR